MTRDWPLFLTRSIAASWTHLLLTWRPFALRRKRLIRFLLPLVSSKISSPRRAAKAGIWEVATRIR